MTQHIDIAIVGGAGHVGLPLALAFANKGQSVLVMDINQQALDIVQAGKLPYMERDGEIYLKNALENNRLFFSADPASIQNAKNIILTIGTPVDEFLNPDIRAVQRCVDDLAPYFQKDQLIILRSTVFPGTTDWLVEYAQKKQMGVDIAFCPERVVQGEVMQELHNIPQLVSGGTLKAQTRASELFGLLTKEIIHLSTKEAEFAKLFTNSYRYIRFATANQFYMMAENSGLDYYRIHDAVVRNYPRMADMPRPGFTAGPCLFKDTMQLAAFAKNEFTLGHDAMLINEGLPLYIVEKLKRQYGDSLKNKVIGLLGMAFKPNCDDIRSSLSYKLKKTLALYTDYVLTTDPYVQVDPTLSTLEVVLEKSDILILCTPHRDYKNLNLRGKVLLNVWGE
jgi:UDP-N-acetyl-D-mannosaminuronic acid dehydrogenase